MEYRSKVENFLQKSDENPMASENSDPDPSFSKFIKKDPQSDFAPTQTLDARPYQHWL